MKTRIYEDLQQLSAAEKRSLGEALIDCADSEASLPPLSDAQRLELLSRLAHHRANPQESGLSFEQLRISILSSNH